MAEPTFAKHARLVIIGGGIVGCSAAYHLAKLGWRDVVVVDKGDMPYNDGSTSHAPGSLHITNFSRMMTRFAVYSTQLYAQLPEHEVGRPPFRPVGGLEVAYTKERMTDLYRKQSTAGGYGVETHLLTPEETQEKLPLLDPKVILGSYYVPGDANVIGWHVAASLANEAKRIGDVQFIPYTPVLDINVQQGQITGVVTDKGTIQCDEALLCANIWAPAISRKAGLNIPLLAAQHQYTVTTPLPELAHYAQDKENREIVHPIMRHQDFSLYFRQHWDSYGVGNYRHVPLMVRPQDLGRTAMLPFTPEHYEVADSAAKELLPPLKQTTLTTKFNGMFAFSVDGYPVMGESQVKGFWAATGVWITHAGGVGKSIAEWMTHGEPEWDLHEADINRFLPHQKTQLYIDLRCAQNYREVYDIIHPVQPINEPRNVRLTPFHARLVELGGEFFQSAGYEVAQWYNANATLLSRYDGQIPLRDEWSSRFWSPIQGAEHLEVRNNVGLFNIAALAVIEVSGPGAVEFLERMAANRIDRPVGKVVYTSLLTPNGGIKADLTIVRKEADCFWVLTGGGLLPHDIAWLRRHAPSDGTVQIVDLSSTFTPLGLWGPNARKVLQKVTAADLSNDAFPYYTMQEIEIGAIPVTALRISYAGELGWELYTQAEFALSLWDTLWAAGREVNLIAAGAGAFDSLRLEKGYRLWGQDIHTDYTPDEAGIGWAVNLKKGDFVGRAALLERRAQGIQRKLCCLVLEPDGLALGKEAVYTKDGDCIGYVTSANYSYSTGRPIAYAYLPVDQSHIGAALAIDYFGRRFAATVVEEPVYDAGMEKIKR
ncbi:FAD-dependent oxidoreductase [bacterium]|nr:FAD-dependent oxidoreductase [bacterium]